MSDPPDCMVCLYRRYGFINGPTFPVNKATHEGVSISFEAKVPVCPEHLDWVTDEFPETLVALKGDDPWPKK